MRKWEKGIQVTDTYTVHGYSFRRVWLNIGGDDEVKRDQMVVQVHAADDADHGGDFSLLAVRFSAGGSGMYDKPLSCFGCGIGWFS